MPNSQRTASARPFVTFYYQGTPSPSSWSRTGHAATRSGAIRAALRHLLDGSARTALVCDEDGIVIARLSHSTTGIRIGGKL